MVKSFNFCYIKYMEQEKLKSKVEEVVQYSRANEHLLQEDKDKLDALLKYSQSIYEDTRKIRRYMLFRVIFNILWLVIVLAPIVVALIYLPPALKGIIGNNQSLIGVVDLMNQLKQIK